MKKLYLCAAVAVLTASVISPAFAAQNNSVSVTSGSDSITLTYLSDTFNEELTENADNLFKDLLAADTSSYTEDVLIVTSSAQSNTNVDVLLRLSVDEIPETEYSPLDYYSFIITDMNGGIVYSSENEEASDLSAVKKDMYIGTFNTEFTEDTKAYKVEYKVSDEGALLSSDDIAGLSLDLVAVPRRPESASAASGNDDTAANEGITGTEPDNAAEATESAEPSAEPTEAAEETKEIKTATKVVGKDIDAGRYVVKGNANISITDKDGKLLSEATVVDGTLPDAKGVTQLIVTLNDGDVITISPLEGQEKAPVSFEKTNTGTASAANTSSTAAPAAARKSNPKTGEKGAAAGIVCGLMAACAAGFAGLEVMKRRKTN